MANEEVCSFVGIYVSLIVGILSSDPRLILFEKTHVLVMSCVRLHSV